MLNENAQCAWACEHVIAREGIRPQLRSEIVHAASDFTVGWADGVPNEEVLSLAKIAHAWEQRLVLSADRAGLLACRDAAAACRAIAVLVTGPDGASNVTVADLLARFKDVPPNELAAISLAHDPWTDPQYAAYRIQMLRWWATTDDYKRLAH